MKRIVHVMVAVVAAMLMVNTAGVGTAVADPFAGLTYGDAAKKIQSWNAKAVIASVVGDQLQTDDCVITRAQKSNARNASGVTGKVEFLLYLDCNAHLAQPGAPGFSAASPQGQQAKQEEAAAKAVKQNPALCTPEKMDFCKLVCRRTGLCEI